MILHAHSITPTSLRCNPARRGVLLLVVLSMLTLFMLLGVTYLIFAARIRTTSRAFLKLADDQARTSITLKPLLKDAALQVIRGTQNSRSVIRYHDLLGDKYGTSKNHTASNASLKAPDGPSGQLLQFAISSTEGRALTGRVVTFLDGPSGVRGTSSRIIAAELGGIGSIVVVMRPKRLAAADIGLLANVLVNGKDFDGTGFSAASTPPGQGQPSLNNSALMPNQTVTPIDPNNPFDPAGANEDYDALDEQNIALAAADGRVRSFERRDVVDFWVRDFARNNAISSRQEAYARLLERSQSGDTAATINVRRATLRPFAFDHFQDSRTGTDFAGRSLATFDVIATPPGDIDNDGDGNLDSVWLDLGNPTFELGDRKRVKPLFAIHCVDLGGRISMNAHGSSMHAAATSVLSNSAYAPRRNTDGSKQPPTRLLNGLGFGPADVRLDAVMSQSNMRALLQGSNSAAGAADGIRRDIGAMVGRYGDGVLATPSIARPGVPNQNDRRAGPRSTWTDRGLPDDYWTKNGTPSSFGHSPPDLWSRFTVGIDHLGHPFYANVAPSIAVSETTDNPYELDLFKPRQGIGYAQDSESPQAVVDQPFTATELEAVLRPFDIDNASTLPQRAICLALAGTAGDLSENRAITTTDTWDTPAVIATDSIGLNAALHDPDLVDGLKMDLNRPFGDALDNNANSLVDEPGETGDPYAAVFRSGWLLTRGQTLTAQIPQPGPDEPHLRARQLLAFHLFNLLDALASHCAPATSVDPGLRLFAMQSDANDDTVVPLAKDPALNEDADTGNATKQARHSKKVLAQWAVNVVDFLDPDAIMTPFRYQAGDLTGSQFVVWGCEFPDVLLTETLAFHDRRTADTKCDSSGETTVDFRSEYTTHYDAWMAWKKGGQVGDKPKYPSVTDSDLIPTDDDDRDFDQVRIPEGSLFIELYGTRSLTAPTLPRELYSFDAANSEWFLDLGRVPQGGTAPVWRLSISSNRAQSTPPTDIFRKISTNPETTWLSPTTTPATVDGTIQIERYVWFSNNGSSLPANGSFVAANGNGPTRNNTFYARTGSPSPRLRPGGYLVVGPRPVTAVGSIKGGVGSQKWGVPSQQQIVLSASAGDDDDASVAVGVYDLKGNRTPAVPVPTTPGVKFGSPLPPESAGRETNVAWVAMDPPASWTAWENSWKGVGTSGIGLNVSEPLRNDYYPCPTHMNDTNKLHDAYGPLDDESHKLFLSNPADQAGGPLVEKLLSGGSFANFCTVFVERLANPTKPHNSDPSDINWNPYITVDFMPIDLTVFNGESEDLDPQETQGPDRQPSTEALPSTPAEVPTFPDDPLEPSSVPLPLGGTAQLAARHTFFHTRQRGFGKDLPNFETYGTLFGQGAIQRNPHPFKPIGSLDDLADTPLRTATPPAIVDFTDASKYKLPGGRATTQRPVGDFAGNEVANFRHELGQPPAGRTVADDWKKIPFHSLGWVNSSFGRRLDAADGVPAMYFGAPDRPFPWIVWNDRPFANPYELIYVPRTPPGRLFTNFRNLDFPNGREPDGTTRSYSNCPDSSYNAEDLFAAPSRGWHLLPISSITDEPPPPATGKTSTRSRNADVFVRIFEYVRVRSPFVSTETALTGFGDDGRPTRFVGPFNRVPTYREPGKININTIHPDPAIGGKVWNALCGDPAGNTVPSYTDILNSRTIDVPFTSLGSGVATVTRPFRIATGNRTNFTESGKPRGQANALFPAGFMTNPPVMTSLTGNRQESPLAVSLGSAASEIDDRFSVRSFTLLGDKPRTQSDPGRRFPLFPTRDIDAWANDGKRNAWFRFETLVRANANATVRSELYAIWVTMGLFEVQPEPISATYPDGYRLVREYGSDTGDVTRNRSFFIFDRSIPIGFERGVDHNVQDGILVERFIE